MTTAVTERQWPWPRSSGRYLPVHPLWAPAAWETVTPHLWATFWAGTRPDAVRLAEEMERLADLAPASGRELFALATRPRRGRGGGHGVGMV